MKEVIQGETMLQVKIADKDKKNPFWLFVRSVLGSVLGSVSKDAIGDISEVFVSNTASGISKKLEDAIKGSDGEKVAAIAESAKVRLEIGDSGSISVPSSGASPGDPVFYDPNAKELSLNLVAPKQLVTAQRRTSSGGVSQDTIEKGQPNGKIVLKLAGESIPG